MSSTVQKSQMDVQLLQEQDATAYKNFLEQLDRETTYLAWEPGERNISLEEIQNRLRTQDTTKKITFVVKHNEDIVGFLVGLRGTVQRLQHRADFTM